MDSELTLKLVAEAKRIEEDAIYSSKGHYNAGNSWKGLHLWIGIPTAILSALASASAFGEENTAAGILSILVTSLIALATFLDPSGKQSAHRASAAAYGTLKNDARIFYEIDVFIEKDITKLVQSLKQLAKQRDKLNSTSFNIPRRAYELARTDIKEGTNTYKIDKEL